MIGMTKVVLQLQDLELNCFWHPHTCSHRHTACQRGSRASQKRAGACSLTARLEQAVYAGIRY